MCNRQAKFVPAGMYGYFPERREAAGAYVAARCGRYQFLAIRAAIPELRRALDLAYLVQGRIEGTHIDNRFSKSQAGP